MRIRFLAAFLVSLIPLAAAQAHFQELVPSSPALIDSRALSLDLAFTHPMARGPAMAMDEPVRFGVLIGGAVREDLAGQLKPVLRQGQAAFQARYAVRRPGDHVFFLEPSPYWEADEGKWIRHYTKVVVDAFSGHVGWDALVGFPVEIEPLTRPYGLWTGNLFRGRVLKDGAPVPFAEVEVEWRNDGSLEAPTDAHRTQLIKADAGGVFAYALPRAGWWGFAGLTEGDDLKAGPDGTARPVEEGALIWVHVRDMK